MILFNIAQKQEKFNKKFKIKAESSKKLREKIKARQKVQRFVLKFRKYILYFERERHK